MKRLAKKVLLIGWDAADWKIINPLMDTGYMPALNKLVNEGVMGNIATLEPPLSPMLWTSIATGKRAYQHGIINFTEPDKANNFVRPVNVTSRKVKALWNILSENNLKSHVAGWWPSHPAEPINGVSVSNFFQRSHTDKEGKFHLVPGCIHPVELENIFSELVVEPHEITPAHILPFIPDAKKIDQEKDKALQSVARILSDASSVHAAATWIMQNREWDFLAVYFDAIDHFCHRFMRFHPPRQEHVPEEQFELYKNAVNGAYRFHDMMLDRYMELAGEDTTIILVSDHGFHSDHLRPKYLPKEPAAPAYEHRHHGIVVMKGENIRKDERIYGSTLLDITPTVLQLFGLPVGRDMEGRVIYNAFTDSLQTEYIDSWEKTEGVSGMHSSEKLMDPWAEQVAMNQLIELGYIEKPGDDKQKTLKVCVDESQFNLARAYMDGRKHKEADAILHQLHNENKETVRFALSYINCSTQLSDFSKAQNVLDELKQNKQAAYLNFPLLQGNLFYRQNKVRKALSQFESALEKQSMNHFLNFSSGKCFMKLNRLDEAESAFLKAISIDENNASYYHALANCYFTQKRYEECIELCLNSIGLLFYFPRAHFLLGESLYRLKQYSEAAKALELFLTMTPDHVKARKRLIEIYDEKLISPEKETRPAVVNASLKGKIKMAPTPAAHDSVAENSSKSETHKKFLDEHKDEVIYIVSGLPRSGTSMMMQLLDAGGMNILADEKRKADKHNMHGYFEFEPVKSIARDASWLEQARGKAVKIIAQNLLQLPSRYQYKIIFMTRNLDEIIHSQQVMLGKAAPGKVTNYPVMLAEAFKTTLKKIKKLEEEINFRFLFIDYKNILENPREHIFDIEQFTGMELDTDKMLSAIDSNCYRSRAENILVKQNAL
ncbi:MAG TPA: alkaline phosphatase family protein [Bacteroidia bacterium]|nr:alkaline phosphatase family protein [Bacteroidia bacterium]